MTKQAENTVRGRDQAAEDSQADFVRVTASKLTVEECAAIVARFEKSGIASPGRVGDGVHPEMKRSLDIGISGRPGWEDVEHRLNQVVFVELKDYVRRYPHVVLAPLRLQTFDPATGGLTQLTEADVRALDDARVGALVAKALRPGDINIQKYIAGEGGYPYWHSEIYPRHGDTSALHRVLLWTLYLNEGFADGETEFLYQARKICPRTGWMLMAPAGFTHTHRGNRPLGGDKFIATGWILFQQAARMYAAGGRWLSSARDCS